jgi:hypothetical protein
MTCVTDVEVDWVPGNPSGQLATDAKIRLSFPNVRTIPNLPVIDYVSDSWSRSDRTTLRVVPVSASEGLPYDLSGGGGPKA